MLEIQLTKISLYLTALVSVFKILKLLLHSCCKVVYILNILSFVYGVSQLV